MGNESIDSVVSVMVDGMDGMSVVVTWLVV